MTFYSNEVMSKIPGLWESQNEKIDDLIAAVLTLAEITLNGEASVTEVDNVFAQKREMLKNRE